ncbi:MAG: PIN domain protein [Candidatus Sumerlaeota bacterium]|nr:PIN domain protein [Candidatus Sumerlaeota bacterium]
MLKGDFIILLSTETLRELSKAPEDVRAVWRQLPPESLEEVLINEEVAELAQAYIKANVLGVAAEADALHVAAATVASADLILSWNFRHIVNYERIRGFNGVNVANGYRPMTILSPREVSSDE